MNIFQRAYEMASRNIFEPAMYWVIDHPLISVAVVAVLIYWSVRGYRML